MRGASEIERVRMRGCETARKRENSNEKDFRDEEEGERSGRKKRSEMGWRRYEWSKGGRRREKGSKIV